MNVSCIANLKLLDYLGGETKIFIMTRYLSYLHQGLLQPAYQKQNYQYHFHRFHLVHGNYVVVIHGLRKQYYQAD